LALFFQDLALSYVRNLLILAYNESKAPEETRVIELSLLDDFNEVYADISAQSTVSTSSFTIAVYNVFIQPLIHASSLAAHGGERGTSPDELKVTRKMKRFVVTYDMC